MHRFGWQVAAPGGRWRGEAYAPADDWAGHPTLRQVKLGQHVVLSLPRYSGCDVIASLPKKEGRDCVAPLRGGGEDEDYFLAPSSFSLSSGCFFRNSAFSSGVILAKRSFIFS